MLRFMVGLMLGFVPGLMLGLMQGVVPGFMLGVMLGVVPGFMLGLMLGVLANARIHVRTHARNSQDSQDSC